MLKWNFSCPGTKIHQKHFMIKATSIWFFNPFINDSIWKVARRQTRFLTSPGQAVKGVILQIWNFHKQVSLQVTLIADVIFQFCRHYQKLHLVCEIRISDRFTGVIVTILSNSKFQFNTMFTSWDTKGEQFPPLNTLHIIMNPKTLKNW